MAGAKTRTIFDLIKTGGTKREARGFTDREPLRALTVDSAFYSNPYKMAEKGGDILLSRTSQTEELYFIGDICGHGKDAEKYRGSIEPVIKSVLLENSMPQSAAQGLQEIEDRIKKLDFCVDGLGLMTATCAIIDREKRTLTYARAGHEYILHFRALDKRPVELKAQTGSPILFYDFLPNKFGEEKVALAAGDVLVLLTDGVYEARRAPPEGDAYERKDIHQVIRKNACKSASEIRAAVEAFLKGTADFRTFEDDVTFAVIKFV